MPTPRIELIPLRPVVASDRETVLDLLIKIHPPAPQHQIKRPPLNLGLVLDRSGSMSGSKIQFAKQAACYAVEQLLPTDRVSVTTFDTDVKTLISTTLVEDKAAILRRIKRIETGSSTALHEGWVQGGIQVSQHLDPKALNRVILLSDGLANVGETNSDTIASNVHGLSKRGVSTSTLGVGDDYDEDLLSAMAKSGDGNFYHIESAEQLPGIFATELLGLMATFGHKVSLGIELTSGVVLKDVFNELEKNSYGRLMLPNLVAGSPIPVVIRLRIPPQSQENVLCEFRLAWDELTSQQRQKIRVSLQLPVVSSTRLDEYLPNPEVQEQVNLQQAAKAKREAIEHLDDDNVEAAFDRIQSAREAMLSAPASAYQIEELQDLQEIEEKLRHGNIKGSRKELLSQSFRRARGQSKPSNQNPREGN